MPLRHLAMPADSSPGGTIQDGRSCRIEDVARPYTPCTRPYFKTLAACHHFIFIVAAGEASYGDSALSVHALSAQPVARRMSGFCNVVNSALGPKPGQRSPRLPG